MTVADVGAGTGLFTLAFAAAVGTAGTVYAVDLIPEFLAHIRASSARPGSPTCAWSRPPTAAPSCRPPASTSCS